ncbi:MAG: AMP-binding protein, partial [Novosphingobium sp.]|nr:AMP-binding protein [Novosphingobium sp.]
MTDWSWVSADLPPREQSVIRHILEARAALHPERVLVQFEDGVSWSYSETLDEARKAAAGLARLGVTRGDVVLA